MELDQQKPSFIRQALVAGLIFAVIIFLLEVIGGFMVIGSDPGGGVILITLFSGAVGCLVAAFAGMVGVRMFVKEHGLPMTLGEGAKIGLVTGAIVAVANAFLDVVWYVVNPSFQDDLLDASIEHVEAITQISEEDRQQIIDMLYTETQEVASFSNIAMGLLGSLIILGLLNTLTGTLGAKFFATQPDQIQDEE